MKIRETDYDDDDFEYAETWEKFKPKNHGVKPKGPAVERQEDRKKNRRPKESEKSNNLGQKKAQQGKQ